MKRLSSQSALRHDWISAGKAKEDDLGDDLVKRIQSVREDDKISRVIGKVHNGTVNLDDIEEDDKKIVYQNVKNQKDVERYLDMYANAYQQPPPPQQQQQQTQQQPQPPSYNQQQQQTQQQPQPPSYNQQQQQTQ
eukprot:545472_1